MAAALEELRAAARRVDTETTAHIDRVPAIAAAIAAEVGWGPRRIELVRTAAELHDLGKEGIPEGILQKRGPLTLEERLQMQMHTVLGARIICEATGGRMGMAAVVALCHHERWDGRGYPLRLRGRAIPRCARIVALADVWDALTSDRPYRPALSPAAALALMREERGQHFDPEVFDVLERLMVG